jgi:hypothetical protein
MGRNNKKDILPLSPIHYPMVSKPGLLIIGRFPVNMNRIL